MGGVDLMDRALSDYRPCIKGKKWYWSLLVNALNISVVFTWRLHSLIQPENKLPQKEFRMALVDAFTKSVAKSSSISIDRPGPSPRLLDRVRTDNSGHVPAAVPPRECVVCKRSARIQCVKCSKTLHINGCFQTFHE